MTEKTVKENTADLEAAGAGAAAGTVGTGGKANETAMRDAEPPTLPRPRMPRSQRAKIFIPFDPLKGYQEALRQQEREAEARMNDRIHLDDPA